MDAKDVPAARTVSTPSAHDRLRPAVVIAFAALVLWTCGGLLYRREVAAVERQMADRELVRVDLLADLLESELSLVSDGPVHAADLVHALRQSGFISRLRRRHDALVALDQGGDAVVAGRLRLFDAHGIDLMQIDHPGRAGPADAVSGSPRVDPALWARIVVQARGQLQEMDALLSWRRVEFRAADATTPVPPETFLVVASEWPAAAQTAMRQGLRRSFALFALASLSLLLCGLWFVHSRRSALSRLRSSEEDLAVTLQSIGDAVIATDTAGRITRMNRVAEQLTAWSQAEASGRPISEVLRIVHQDTREPAKIPVREVLDSGEVKGLANHTMLIARDGREYAIADSAAPIRALDGSLRGVVLVFRDISAEYAAARALRDSELRYRGLFESIDEGFCIIEMLFDGEDQPIDYRFLEINPAFERQTGLRDAQGKRMRELAPEHEAHWFETYGRIALTGQPLRFQNRAEQLQRSYDVYAFRIGDPELRHVAILFNDISARLRVQEELDRFFSLSLDFLCISSGDGYFKRVSPAVTGMLGWSVEEFLAQPYIELVHPDDRAATQREVERQMRAGEKVLSFENRYAHKDGSWRVLSWRSAPHDGLMYATARDVTEYRRMAQALRESNEQLERKVQERTAELQAKHEQLLHSETRFRALIEHAAEGIAVVDGRNDSSYVSPGMAAVEGRSEQDLAGHSLFEHVHAEDLAQVRDCLARAAQRPGQPMPLLWRRRHQDGRWLWLEGFVTNLRADEAVHGMVINYHDITHRHVAEQKLRQFAESLERSNRDLQDFAHVVSHDLQEPLRKILMFGERLAARCGDALDETSRDFMQRMLSAAERSRRLIGDLLTYSRVTTSRRQFQRIDLAEVARDVVSDLDAAFDQYGGSVEIGALPTIEAHPTQVRQLLQNLIGNALKFRRPDVAARVVLTSEWDDTHVTLYVRDNGIGFEERYAERIFEVFQRLVDREAYDGSGIGLSVCRKIVEAHGGTIVARSTVGAGSTFVVTLPLVQVGMDALVG